MKYRKKLRDTDMLSPKIDRARNRGRDFASCALPKGGYFVKGMAILYEERESSVPRALRG
jgi:hypothetical protein